MKILKILGIIVLVIGLLFLGALFFAPTSAHFEREISINAPARVVFAEVSNMKTFNEWSPWYKMDPDAEYQWEGPSLGVGAKQIWYSNDQYVGNGYMMVSEAIPNEFVALEMGFDNNGNRDFTDEGEEKPQAAFVMSENGDNTLVKWTFDITGVSGTDKFMNWALPMFLGPAYEQGLADLKTRIENGPSFSVEIDPVETESMPYLGVNASSSSDPDMIGKVMGDSYEKVTRYMSSNGIEMSGFPICIILGYDETSTEMICAIPTSELIESSSEEVVGGMTHEGLVLKTIHKGDYALMENTYNELVTYTEYYNLEYNGNPWEVYVTDPASVTDTTQWITEIYFPVK